jgi:hypothetical protein
VTPDREHPASAPSHLGIEKFLIIIPGSAGLGRTCSEYYLENNIIASVLLRDRRGNHRKEILKNAREMKNNNQRLGSGGAAEHGINRRACCKYSKRIYDAKSPGVASG